MKFNYKLGKYSFSVNFINRNETTWNKDAHYIRILFKGSWVWFPTNTDFESQEQLEKATNLIFKIAHKIYFNNNAIEPLLFLQITKTVFKFIEDLEYHNVKIHVDMFLNTWSVSNEISNFRFQKRVG